MLVLTRKKNQRIQIGEATVTIVRIGRDNVRIGVEAPADVPVVRSELLASPRPRLTPSLSAEAAA